jgi:gamma-glutamyltranspeptidase/glutathione hydrolase
MLLQGRAPEAGEVMRMPNLANTFRELAKHGKKGFYGGRIAEEIVKLLSDLGGLISLEDLKNHHSTMDKPISINYKVSLFPAFYFSRYRSM